MNKNTNPPGSVSSSDLIDAKLEEHQLCGSKQCPCCGHKLEGKPDWVGFPAGVKFDPTDQELIEHLEAKVEGQEAKSHPLIDEFIPTIEGDDGICYTHPEKLPGVTRDGLSRHFFHRPSKAYTTGTRKRRKIQMECDQPQATGGGETRWHKTGKTRPVMANGKQKGCKKILVLYTNFGKNRKPEKTNWVMHQYHLGQHEEEKEGELVVSKIFYQTQPRQCSWSDKNGGAADVKENRGTGTGSSSSSAASKEIILQSDDFSGAVIANISTVGAAAAAAVVLPIPSYVGMDHLIGYLPLRKPFDEVVQAAAAVVAAAEGGGNIGEASIAREVGTCEEREMGGQHHHFHEAAAAYHISSSRPLSHSISNIISAPLMHSHHLHHQTSIDNILHQQHPPTTFHLPLPTTTHTFQQQQQQEQEEEGQHHKIGGRSASGLEELIMMGCTSSTTHIKQQESGMGNTQEAEWLKYSSFWPDPPHNQHHHG